jgi:hypothetical protein
MSTVEIYDILLDQHVATADGLLRLTLPQNQQPLRNLLERPEPQKPLNFAAGDT